MGSGLDQPRICRCLHQVAGKAGGIVFQLDLGFFQAGYLMARILQRAHDFDQDHRILSIVAELLIVAQDADP